MKDVNLKRNRPIPLYYQIEQYLRHQIKSGDLKPGDQILTEEKLRQKFNVSRATVRKAISELAYDGLLETNYSKGTIVTQPKVTQRVFEAASFTNDMLKLGKKVSSKIVKFSKLSGNKSISQKLKISENDTVYLIKRIRYVDDVQVCVELNYLPAKIVPELSQSFFSETDMKQSIYYVLREHYNLIIKHVLDTISATAVSEKDAALLDISKNSPVLLRERITYDVLDRPIMYSKGSYNINLTFSYDAENN